MIVSHAAVHGRSHRLMQQNGQDFALSGQPRPGRAFGLILDGCGGKYQSDNGAFPSHNEVGAKLLGQFAAAFLTRALSAPDADPAQIVPALEHACLDFLTHLTKQMPLAAPQPFIATHLLATLLGFMVTPATAVFFHAGDGYLCHNDALIPLNADNQPDYLAYRLLDPDAPGLHTRPIPRAGLRRVAVASDGWQPDALTALPSDAAPLLLQRHLNQLARQPGHFEDDGAVAVCRLPPHDP